MSSIPQSTSTTLVLNIPLDLFQQNTVNIQKCYNSSIKQTKQFIRAGWIALALSFAAFESGLIWYHFHTANEHYVQFITVNICALALVSIVCFYKAGRVSRQAEAFHKNLLEMEKMLHIIHMAKDIKPESQKEKIYLNIIERITELI
jgi:hypothetical protein